jgi:hypothetical protein
MKEKSRRINVREEGNCERKKRRETENSIEREKLR